MPRHADVIIDPGHGGTTSYGGSSPLGVEPQTGLSEKHVNLELARRVVVRLGGLAQLTRTSDVNVPLRERAQLAARSGARVLVSIHANAGAYGTRGSEVWVHDHHDAHSAELARAIHGRLDRVGPARGIYRGPLAVLDPSNTGGVAACLVEAEYLSDPQGRERLTSAQGLDELAGAIADGVRGYLGQAPSHGSAWAEPKPSTALKVIGTNDIRLVGDSTAIPYRYIARLRIGLRSDRGHGHVFGTGTLISPDIILTAAHNLRRDIPQLGRPCAVADEIEISIAGRGPFRARDWWAHERWMNAANDNAEAEYDYGLIRCRDQLGDLRLPNGDSLRSWGTGRGTALDRIDPANIVDVHVAGFPSRPCVDQVAARDGVAIPHPALMESSGSARPTTSKERVFGYDADTCPEQSGGPVWVDDRGVLTFVGVHHGTWRFPDGRDLNSATRLTREMIDTIDDAINHNRWRRD